jgi:hypothetical protein
MIRFPILGWLLFGSEDSNPTALVSFYACAGIAVDRLLPECILLGPDAMKAGSYKPKRYGFKNSEPLGDAGWKVGWPESQMRPFVLERLVPFLESVPPDWQVRLAPPWAIVIAHGCEIDDVRMLDAAVELAKLVENS